MSFVETINAQIGTQPNTGSPTGVAYATTPICLTRQLALRTLYELELTTDSPVAIQFGSVTAANTVNMNVFQGQGNAVTAAVTWANGTGQTIPFDPLLLLQSDSQPITAITLTRTPGVDTIIEIFLGQNA